MTPKGRTASSPGARKRCVSTRLMRSSPPASYRPARLNPQSVEIRWRASSMLLRNSDAGTSMNRREMAPMISVSSNRHSSATSTFRLSSARANADRGPEALRLDEVRGLVRLSPTCIVSMRHDKGVSVRIEQKDDAMVQRQRFDDGAYGAVDAAVDFLR